MEKTWLWDVKRTKAEAQAILSNPDNPKFVYYAALLLARSNEPKEVFTDFINKDAFCRYWQSIKRRMQNDKWNKERVVFWDQIYKYLIREIKAEGGTLRKIDARPKSSLLAQKVGSAIKTLRCTTNLTQGDLAKRAGVAQQVISKIERGIANPSVATIEKIIKCLKGKIDFNITDFPSFDPQKELSESNTITRP